VARDEIKVSTPVLGCNVQNAALKAGFGREIAALALKCPYLSP
jgi:hypothetical protein